MDESSSVGPLSTPDATDTEWRLIDPPQLPNACDSVQYHPDTETYSTSFDSVESVALQVVSTVAIAAETDPLDLPPLHYAVDTDALAELSQATIDGPSNTVPNVTFAFADYIVNVHSKGVISVQPSANEGAVDE